MRSRPPFQVRGTDGWQADRAVRPEADPAHGLAEVLAAAQQGDRVALRSLVARFEPMMRCVARRYVRGRHDVDDAVQDAWLSFTRSIASIRTPEAVGGWLCVTVARASLAIARRRDRTTVTPLIENRSAIVPDDGLELDHTRRTVRAAVGRLDQRDRELLWLLFDSELTYAEITERTGRAIGAIGPSRQRAIEKLRRDRSIRALASPDT